MKEFNVYVFIFYVGLMAGYFIRTWMTRRTNYNGTIYVNKNEDKLLYSLELDDDPDLIQYKKTVRLKVDTSRLEIPDRD